MKFKVITFGCQMNVYDTGRIERYLVAGGHEAALTEDMADLLVINTCAIRDTAESRVYGTLGRLAQFKRERPGRLVAVAGCMAQKEGVKILKHSGVVDVVVGTMAIPRIPSLIEAAAAGLGPQVDISRSEEDLFDEPEWIEKSFSNEEGERQRIQRYPAFISIMQGCSKVCSFCVVPYTRGKEVCRPPEDVIAECHRLVRQGIREVTLIGQNVDSYRYEEVDFADLLLRVSRIEELSRIRFTTSHPKDMTPKLIDTVGECANICESFHFPLQSGCNRILDAMKRDYTVDEYFEKLEYIEKVFGSRGQDPFAYGISTDLMVGFANETEQEFEETLEAVRRARWDSAFMFKYSPRERTAAYRWEDRVSEEEKSERLARLIELQESISLALNRQAVGRVAEVLVEGIPGYDPEQPLERIKARTRTNKSFSLNLPEDPEGMPSVGETAYALVTDCKPVTLRGEFVGSAVTV
ncbi:MAG: tRNA-2-methylthio-N(6)-dimethylallyladenosine synthase [Candidatus Hinthialibacteria bacterium]|nr:tRNA (N6-isopentenyl adenosine(37)-C2)-methylthiotransferase MiaB [bacterium]MBV6481796.1 tRNA-2-methylthio-N(6)-dimethylallyladenosine synthase [bacterium]MCC6731628.1 tRNA (N6-isopentenyl adenosine(37)-C2)-methylthiotransferase MiaB [Candidatus Omnitrophota bacterium]